MSEHEEVKQSSEQRKAQLNQIHIDLKEAQRLHDLQTSELQNKNSQLTQQLSDLTNELKIKKRDSSHQRSETDKALQKQIQQNEALKAAHEDTKQIVEL